MTVEGLCRFFLCVFVRELAQKHLLIAPGLRWKRPGCRKSLSAQDRLFVNSSYKALRTLDDLRSALYLGKGVWISTELGEKIMDSSDREEQEKQTVQEAGAKGGKARAKNMTPEQRREAARRAVEARWNADVAQAICGSPERPLVINEIEIQAYVLDDGTRVLTQGDFQEALGRHRKANVRYEEGEEQTPPILQGKSIKPFISSELMEKSKPIKFRTPHGTIASGYRADILPEVCEVFLKARDAQKLNRQLHHIADRANILIRGLATVGIIALVDECTGYQEVRAKNALAKILEQFIATELKPYVSAFPLDWFRELCRLRGLSFREDMRLPKYFGRLVNSLVYCRLAPGVLAELNQKNPIRENGRRANKHYRWLTENVGHPKLLHLLGSEVTLMKMSKDWNEFKELVDKFHPPHQKLPLLDWAEECNKN